MRAPLKALPAVVSIGAAVLGAAAPAGASFPGANGRISYEANNRIVSVAPGGGRALALTGHDDDHEPASSPDGNRIAYVHARDIWVMNADGSGKRALTRDQKFNAAPAWSPDGRRIVFSRRASGKPDIYVTSVAGGPLSRLTATPANEELDPAWSPDGTQIAYTRNGCEQPDGGGECVYVMNADGSGQADLTPEDRVGGCEPQPGFAFHGGSAAPAWSPDSARIAFRGPTICDIGSVGTDIWVMGRDGSGKTDVSHDEGTDDGAPSWSPDGSQLAFQTDTDSDTPVVRTMAAGGGPGARVSTGAFAATNPDWAVAPTAQCVVPKLRGRRLGAARAALVRGGCKLGRVGRRRGRLASGRVLSQGLPAGSRGAVGEAVAVVVSRGRR